MVNRFRSTFILGTGVVCAALSTGLAPSVPGADATTAQVTSVPTPPPGSVAATFGYTGGVQKYTVGEGTGWLQISAVGGAGGENSAKDGSSYGATVTGTVKVSPGDVFLLSVAGAGGQDDGWPTAGGAGGWGGMGANGGDGDSSKDALRNGGAGGGASTVQVVSGGSTSTVMVAGGGGGKGGASGDPDHAGSGGDGGINGWVGGDGGHGTSGPLGGSGGKAGAASSSLGEHGQGGSGAGGDGGAGVGGYVGGTAGGGASGASAGGGGGAGSSYVSDVVLRPAIQKGDVHWCDFAICSGQPVPNGSIAVTPIPLLAATIEFAVQNPQVRAVRPQRAPAY